jgi:beta-lactamase class A
MMRPGAACLAASLAAWLGMASLPARGDEAPGGDIPILDPVLTMLGLLERTPPLDDPAPLWGRGDPDLQTAVEAALVRLQLDDDTRKRRLSVVLVDISDSDQPRVASVNGDRMIYAASLPKIAVLLTVFEQIEAGNMKLDSETEELLRKMIRRSDNRATTELMHRAGVENIANALLDPRYRLYDPAHNGGLWVGKDYASAGLWRRDPIHNLSHGATAMQVARFYYLLETGNLVSPKASRQMKSILEDSQLNHKFLRVLRRINPSARTFRKSGSWRTFHSDSVLVKKGRRGYIAVALSNDAEGKIWLGQIIEAFDALIFPKS